MVFRCLGGVLVFGLCSSGVLGCSGGILVVFWWYSGGVLVFRWRSGVLVVFWSCSRGVLVFCWCSSVLLVF